MKKRIVMAMLAAMMVVSNVTPVLAVGIDGNNNLDSGTLNPTTATKEAIYKISVPTSMNMYLDPYQLAVDNDDSYIVSDDFTITNKSNIAVQVEAKVTLTPGTNVTVKDTAADVTETDNTKLIYVEAQIPTSVTEKKANGATYYKTETWTDALSLYKKDGKYYSSSVTGSTLVADEMKDVAKVETDYTTNTPVSVAVTATDGATMPFLLQAAEYIDYYASDTATDVEGSAFQTTAADSKGTAAFRLSGKLNTNATWTTSDITAKVEYSLLGLAKGKYNEKATAFVTDGGHVYIGGATSATTAEAPTFTAGTKGIINYTAGSGNSALDTITGIYVDFYGTEYNAYTADDGVWSAATLGTDKITIAENALAMMKTLGASGTVSARIEYNDAEGNSGTPVTVQLVIE